MFDPHLNALPWFDESLVPEGWFDSDLISLPTLQPLLAVFFAVKPDYAHPQHDHDDLVGTGTADFLALAVVVVAVLKRLRFENMSPVGSPLMKLALRTIVTVGLLALLGVQAAHAADAPELMEVDLPNGTRIVVSGEGALAYPENGAIVRAASARLEGRVLTFSDLSILSGRVTISRLSIPARGFGRARISGLAADGQARSGRVNELIAISGVGYAVTLQEAVVGVQRGLTGLRLHLTENVFGLPAGTDVLVGLPPTSDEASRPGPLALVSDLPLLPGGSYGYLYPLALRGAIIGCPFALGSTHSPLVPPNNLASDNAVDIAVPVGTPVLAVASGTIGSKIGPLDSADPHMAGLRLHLDTPNRHFYYAHLSRVDVQSGQHVEAGQQLGLSGSAAGAAHLHFAQDSGNPAETVGAASACPFFSPYPEPWG